MQEAEDISAVQNFTLFLYDIKNLIKVYEN